MSSAKRTDDKETWWNKEEQESIQRRLIGRSEVVGKHKRINGRTRRCNVW